MGKANLSVNTMLMRKEVFADLVNGALYGGQQVLKAEDLEPIPTHSGVFYETENGKKNALERQGDVRMKADLGTYSVILASEPQNNVHYAMPVRGMLYDALEDTSLFRSCLRHIFNMVKLRRDKRGLYRYMEDHQEELDRFDSVERNAALMLLGEQKRVARYLNKKEGKGEERTMCEEFRDVFEESWFEGKVEGKIEGKMEGENRMAELVRRLLADKRQEDLEKALEDSQHRLQMFEAYGI